MWVRTKSEWLVNWGWKQSGKKKIGVSTKGSCQRLLRKETKEETEVHSFPTITLVKIPIKRKGIKRPNGPSCTMCRSSSIRQWVQGICFKREMLRCDIKRWFFSGMHQKSVIGFLISSLMLPPSYLIPFKKTLWFCIMCQVVVWHRSRGLRARNTV